MTTQADGPPHAIAGIGEATIDIAAVQRAFDRSPFNDVVRPVIRDLDAASMTISTELEVAPHHRRIPDGPVVHGGVIAALADTTAAVLCVVVFGRDVATIALTVNYLAAAKSTPIRAHATIRHSTPKLAFCEVSISTHDGPVAFANVQMRLPGGDTR